MQEITKAGSTQIYDILNKLPFFHTFQPLEKKKISSCFTNILQFQAGEHLIVENSYDAVFFILLSGSVEVMKESTRTSLAILRPGQFFGEISFLTHVPRTSSVIAKERVLVLRIDPLLMDNLSAEIREKIKDRVIEQLIERMKHMNSKLSEFNTISTASKEFNQQ